MASRRDHRSLLGTTALASFDPIIRAFIDDLRDREGIAGKRVGRYRGTARHFVVWLALSGIALDTVDCTVIERFLDHDCECCTGMLASAGFGPWSKRRSWSPLMDFVYFLERAGKIETPGELDENLQLLDDHLDHMRGSGYAAPTLVLHRSACANLIVWLHFSRIPLRDLTLDAYARFRNRRFICSIPGVFYGQGRSSPEGTRYDGEIRKFLDHLAAIGRIEPLDPAPEEELTEVLERFSAWLERHRGLRPKTIRQYTRLIAAVLPDLGDDPRVIDAALIRRVLFEQLEHRSASYAKRLTTAMRMYLRFLASEDSVTATLVEAVPTTVPQWRLSALPRYIPADDVERAIASCNDDPVGVRNRAILLLLARLALRAGDVVDLRLGDIDWEKAEIRVAGKSRRQTVLPLPQDVGDALHAYIATVRPTVDDEKVFLCANAPSRPFSGSHNVSYVARSALDRAGVPTLANRGRGAHVFRHSQATELLRSGATLDTIQSLLRHESRNSTAIYAKTDTVMLQEVAQPWIGGMEG
ncbi:MAG: tyrosine-type recombinase/integrase [Deltaproteobacteria bacterium]|nr:tyrosine-type recombinase/integrase [Deltaproteobacteria bacterium]